MIIGIPKEVKTDEYRVSLTPDKVDLLVKSGHTALVERNAGAGAACTDEDYVAAGASIIDSPAEIFERADMVVKVKEPQPQEYGFLREGLVLFTFLHLAPASELTQALLDSKTTGVAYETVVEEDGSLPILCPMSEIAGILASQVATRLLQNLTGGPGKLMGGVPGTDKCTVAVVGGGTVGFNAARMAVGLGAEVVLFDVDLERLRYIDQVSQGAIKTLYSTPQNIADQLTRADVVVGGVHLPGARTKRVVTSEMLRGMRRGAVVIDVAIDQGGCVEGARPTTHSDPTYEIDGVTMYAVANMPGVVSSTSSVALSNATLPYVRMLANDGFEASIQQSKALAGGVNTLGGHLTFEAIAEAQGREYVPLETALTA